MVERAPSIVGTVITAVGIAVCCSLTWLVFAGQTLMVKPTVLLIARMPVLQSVMLCFTFWLIYSMRIRLSFANRGIFGETPILFILSIGLIVSVILFPLRTIFDYFLYWDSDKLQFITIIVHSLPLWVSPWAIGVVIALLVQESAWLGISSPQLQRLLDGATLAFGMAAASFTIWSIHVLGFWIPGLEKFAALSAFLPTLAIFSAIYFMVGYLVIDRVRQSCSPARAAAEHLIWTRTSPFVGAPDAASLVEG
jgi:hypothetical protein